MASPSSTSNPDPSKPSLSETTDPWSRPIDDNDPINPAVAVNPRTTPSTDANTDTAPPGSDGPPSLHVETPPFASSVPKVQVDLTVLDEVDPQGSKVEQEARNAWEHSESHPPVVPPKPSPVQSDPPTQDSSSPLPTTTQSHPPPALIPVPDPVPIPPTQTITNKLLPDPSSTTSATQDPAQSISRSTTPSLSGLAAIARTFIPKSPVRISRPLSIDQATAISSPTTATFGLSAQEQGSSHRRSQSQGPASTSEAHSKRDENSPQTPGLAPRTPKSTAKDVDKDHPPPFDFQFFLEQMKSKPAEPVARYLRS